MDQTSADTFVADRTIQKASQAPAEPEGDGRAAGCAPTRPIALWSYDRLSQHEAEQHAAGLGLACECCELPEELDGCGLVILDLDRLHPWGDAESIYQAALQATAGAMLVGVTYNQEHPLAGRLRLFRSVLEVLTAVANNRLLL